MENNVEKVKKNRCADWTVMLCDVLLFASATNCLFQMLAYGKAFDIIIFILSLGLGIFVYFKALDSKKNPVVAKRLTVAISSVLAWAIIMPLIGMIVK